MAQRPFFQRPPFQNQIPQSLREPVRKYQNAQPLACLLRDDDDVYSSSRTYQNVPERTGTYQNVPERHRTYQNVTRTTRTYHSSEPAETYQNVPEHTRTKQNVPERTSAHVLVGSGRFCDTPDLEEESLKEESRFAIGGFRYASRRDLNLNLNHPSAQNTLRHRPA